MGRTKAKAATTVPLSTSTGFSSFPGNDLDVVFSFDTTGSMGHCLQKVRDEIDKAISRLCGDIPTMRVAVFAHGDYCDTGTYVTKYVDFTNDVVKLCHFVKNVSTTGGGDWEECYELVLRQVRELLSWTPGRQRILIMVGDAVPHDTKYRLNKDKIDWKKEVDRLNKELGVRIYAVQAGGNNAADYFWKALANETDGKRLTLQNFSTIIDMLLTICYKERGAEFFHAYEHEVRMREGAGIADELNVMFDALRDSTDATTSVDAAAAAVATPAGPVVVPKRKKTSFAKAPSPKRLKVTPAVKKVASPKMTVKKTVKKAAKGRVRKTATKILRKTKKVNKRKIKKTRKSNRESVSNRSFILGDLNWSPWQLLLTPKIPDGEKFKDRWIKQKNAMFAGFRNTSLFWGELDEPAAYEFAVRPSFTARKYPVYIRLTNGLRIGHLDTRLLELRNVRQQVSRILRNNGSIFVRRAELKFPVKSASMSFSNLQELQSAVVKTYNYAWRYRRTVKRRGKIVTN